MSARADEAIVESAIGRVGYQSRNTKAEYFRLTRREVEALVRWHRTVTDGADR